MSALLLKLMDSDSNGPALRGGLDKNGNQVFSLFDLGNISCKRERDSTYGKNNFYRLTKEGSEYKNEVDSFTVYLKFPGSGQRQTPCASIRGLQRYLLLLGGKVASEFREIIEGTFTRVMAGDTSLIEVINANAVSQEPVQQAFRQALAQEPVEPVLDDFCLKRKREDRLFEMEMAERQLVLDRERLALDKDRRLHTANLIQDATTAMGAISALKDLKNVDERTKMQAEDHIKNVLFNKTSPTDPAANETTPLNVSILAKELGFKCSDGDVQRIGREMAKQYRETYGCNPPKHKQFVNGNYIPVNSYMERDRGVMERVIRDVMNQS